MSRKHRTSITWLLVVVMTYSPSLVFAQPPTDAKQTKAEGKAKIDTSYITPETTAAAVLYPRHVLTAPGMEMLPIEVITAAGKSRLGIDPLEIEQVVAIVEPPASLQAGPPQAGIVVRMASPLAEGEILAPLWEQTQEAKIEGKTYRKAAEPMGFSIFCPDEHTVIVAHDPLLHKILDNHAKPKPGKMAKFLGRLSDPPDASAVLLVEPIRPLITQSFAKEPVPMPFQDVKRIPELLNSIGAKANFTGDMAMSLTLRATDEKAAEDLERMIHRYIEMGKQMMAMQMTRQSASNDPVEKAVAQYSKRVSEQMIELLRPVRKGDALTLGSNNNGKANAQMANVAVIGILISLLLPAVQAAREAARRAQSINNLKEIMLAMHVHHDVHKTFPPRAIFNKEGKPMLSWRVQLLPHLEEQALYDQFHQDEPWDSEHNKKLIPMMPKVFQNPSGKMRPGMANYLAVCGKGLAFDGTKGLALNDFKDGTSRTIVIVEADDDRAVTWTKPDDWQFDPKHPMAGLGNAHPNSFNVGFADGSVRTITKQMDPKMFHALLTIAGDELTSTD